jgi:hypothetical protein
LKNAYGEDPSKWQKSAQVAAGLIKDPLLNQASVSFINFFKEYGPDYRKWSPPQQKAAGIDPKTPYYSVEQSKQQDVLSIYEDKQTNKDEKNNLLKQYIDSKNGLKNLSNYDIHWLAYGIGDQNKTFNNSFMSPQEAKDLLNRKDLNPTTIPFLKQIAGNENQQPSQQQQTPNGQENQALGGTDSVKQISLIQDESKRNEELKKYIASKGGLDKLDNQDIDNLVASIAGFGDYSDDNIKSGQTKLKRLDKSFLNSQQAQELLKRMDLDEFTIKNLKQFISGQNTQQQPPATNKEPAAQNLPPAEKAKRQQEIVNELKDIDEQLEDVSDLLILLNIKEPTDENIQKIYNDNKAAFDYYAERKKIDKNMSAIVSKLVEDQDSLETRQKTLKDEATKLDKQ